MIEVEPIKTITISEHQLDQIIEKAAARGATAALARIGLDDEHAARDVLEFRSLLEAYRDAKKTATRTIVRWSVMLFITVLFGTLYIKGGGSVPKF